MEHANEEIDSPVLSPMSPKINRGKMNQGVGKFQQDSRLPKIQEGQN